MSDSAESAFAGIKGDSDADVAHALRALKRDFDRIDAWRETGDLSSCVPESGSCLAGDDKATKPFQTSHAVIQCLNVSLDHLHFLRTGMAQGETLHVHSYAPYSLLRAALESAATVGYLLEPSSRDERVTRRLKLANADAKDRRDMREILGQNIDAERLKLQDELRAVAARRPSINGNDVVARAPGYKTIVTEGGKMSSLGNLHILAMWQRCSGMLHARQWAALAVLNRDSFDEATDGNVSVTMMPSMPDVALVTACSVVLLAEARDLFILRAKAPSSRA